MSKCEQFSLFPENFALSDDGFSGICGEFADAGDIDHRLFAAPRSNEIVRLADKGHCCKVSDEAAFCLIQRPYISKTLLTRRISPRGSP